MRNADPFRLVHVGALALCLVLMPWSTALLSMAQILLAINWIAGGFIKKDRGARWSRALGSAPSLLFLAFLGVHVAGLLWTSPEGLGWGMDVVRLLLPVLVFGVVLGGSDRLTSGEYRFILLIGAWSVIASTVVSLVMRGIHVEYRQLSVFISHIRLSLFLCMSIVVLFYYARGPLWRTIAHVLASIWALIYIDRLGSIQGFVILLVLGLVLLWRWAAALPTRRRWLVRSLAVLPFLLVISWTAFVLNDRYSRTPETVHRPTHSAGGERYAHDPDNDQRENGRLVWSNIAWAEVHRTWQLRSVLPLDTLDGRGHLLYPTLFRYLTSMGLPKDSVGIMALTEVDVQRVEAGITNSLYGERVRLRDRFEEVMFEIDQYVAEGRVSGHSLTMRLEFWRTGIAIAQDNLLLGVGTGDTQIAFDEAYQRMESTLAEEWRHRAHDQYLTWLISFGLLGTAVLLFCLWRPAYLTGAAGNTMFIAWAIIIGIGSLTDDTLETQAGATFFALYYAFFVLAAPRPSAPHSVQEVHAMHKGSNPGAMAVGASSGRPVA